MFALSLSPAPQTDLAPGAVAAALLPRANRVTATASEGAAVGIGTAPAGWGKARTGLFHCRQSASFITAWARLDDTDTLANSLGEAKAAADDAPHLILRAYQRWGRAALDRLRGDFAFVLYDGREKRLFAARDQLGIRPLYWWHDGGSDGHSVVATSLPGLMACAKRSFDVDPGWVARYVAGTSMSHERTPFAGIAKVPPAHWLEIADGSAATGRHHDFPDDLPNDADDEAALVAGYRAHLRRSVHSRIAVHAGNAIETSGGLDSSTVLGFAMEAGSPARAAMHGFGFASHEGEAEAILSVSQATGLADNHLFTSGEAASDKRLDWQVLGHPAEHGNAVAHVPIYALAERLNLTGLHSGFGGDEGVTNYAPNFHREMMARRRYRALWSAGGPGLYRSARYVAGAIYRANRPSTYSENIMRNTAGRIAGLPLRPEIVRQYGIDTQLSCDARYDWPIPTVNGFAVHMLGRPFVSTRTESCSLMAANYGLEYFWPLLDVDLIANFLSAPTELKVKERVGRALHRAAVAGIVPDSRRLARGKYIGEAVRPMPGFAASSAQDELSNGTFGPVHAMLEDMLDMEQVDRLRERFHAGGEDSKTIMARRTLRALSSVNSWLEHRDAS